MEKGEKREESRKEEKVHLFSFFSTAKKCVRKRCLHSIFPGAGENGSLSEQIGHKYKDHFHNSSRGTMSGL